MKMPRWLRLFVLGAALLFAASFVVSRALRLSSARRYLTAHLAASFGRPVDVSFFDFSLLNGARIEAHQVTVAEDPHFGNEYFLRADTVAASPQWAALLGGRFEFGSVSLSRPSLNLVRDAKGEWNIERWLPPASAPAAPPGFVGPLAAFREVRATRPTRVQIDQGRVNFKRGEDKVPFALADVSGSVERNGAGRWQLDVEARPMRAGVELQDIGTVRLVGSVAGTTARLQPAELAVTWRAASLADALRLISQNDYGMRGDLAVDLEARIGSSQADSASPVAGGTNLAPAHWSVSGVARLTGIHGWRLPERATDPAVNLSLDADWLLGRPRVEIRKLLVEMPASRLEAAGDVDWSRGLRPELRLANSIVALGDALSWYKALRPDVAEDLQATGTLGLDLKLAGWPLELQDAAVTSTGGALAAKALPAPLRIGALRVNASRGKIDLSPTEISFVPASAGVGNDSIQAAPPPRNLFLVRGSFALPANAALRWPPDWSLSIEGAISRVQDWLALSTALALPLNSGWTASGSLAAKMRGERGADPSTPPAWTGTMDFQALTLSPWYVNQPVSLPKAHIEFTPTQRTIALSSAAAFGAIWRGSIARKLSDEQWSFDLTADHLDALELDRWLGPRARPGFLARMIGSDSSAASGPIADAPVTRLAAHGRLRAGSISVPPLQIENLDAQVELAGRAIRIRDAQGDFFGGKISGSFVAELLRTPSYEFQGRFDRVDLALLGRSVPSLDRVFNGTASATLTLSAHGIGRQDLLDSMEGQGTLTGRNNSLRDLDFPDSLVGPDASRPAEPFASAQGRFRIEKRGIDVEDLVFEHSSGRLQARGRIDFSHALTIQVHPSVRPGTDLASRPPPDFLLSGTVEDPKPIFPASFYKQPVRRNSR